MTPYRKYSLTEIELMAGGLNQELTDGTLSVDILEMFKFRGPAGNTWTILPQDGSWYRYQAGKWQPTKAPATSMDGTIEILSIAMLPFSPAENHTPEQDNTPPPQQDLDVRKTLERATERVRDAYNNGKINSDGALNLLKDLYVLDPAGLIWSCGMHTGKWYFFGQDDWELSPAGPKPENFQVKQSKSPKYCSNCGTPLNAGKFCSECGTPASPPESPDSQAAKDVVVRFTESGVAPLPEQIVPDWTPAPGFPEKNATDSSVHSSQTAVVHKQSEIDGTLAEQITNQQSSWKLRVSQGVDVGQIFSLEEYARLGRTNTNEIMLSEQQSSRLHAIIQRQDNSYIITDQNSTNGTLVNGVRIQSPTSLHLGDTISIGGTNFVVEGEAIAPATIVSRRPPQEQSSPEISQPAPSVSPPMKRNRRIILLSVIVFVVTCLCFFTLGFGGYLYFEDQSLASMFDDLIAPNDTIAQPPEEISSEITSPPASPTPTVLPSEIADPYGHSMVLVSAGAFEMGSDADIAMAECLKLHDQGLCDDPNWHKRLEPIHTITLGDYYIDRYEVTNAQYAIFLNLQGNQEESGTTWLDDENEVSLIVVSNGSWQPKGGYANHPVIQANWFGARAYCQWRGARLPTEAEWEKAARGTDGRLYPWGNSFDGERLNFCDGNCSEIWASTDYDDGYSGTAPVGSYSDGVSPYGLHDMAGNASEWVADWYDVYPGGDPESTENFGREYRGVRGGSWYSTGAIGTTWRVSGKPDKPLFSVGFRCVRSP